MTTEGATQPGVATQEILRLFALPPSTLSNWVRAGLCAPSILGSDGQRAVRYWSVKDVVTVRAIKELRESGCPIRTVARVAAVLSEKWGASMADSVLFWDGRDVLTLDTSGNVVSVIRQTGQSLLRQTVLQITSIPVGEWAREAAEIASPVDVERIRQRRQRRRDKYAPGEAAEGGQSA